MIMSIERIEKAMLGISAYLKEKNSNYRDGAEYCIHMLKKKGISAKAHEYEYVNIDDSYWGVHFDYHGWIIWIEEEMYAERKSNHKEVLCP